MDAKTMRALGMIVRAAWPDGDVPGEIINTVTTMPATGVALLAKRLTTMVQDDLRHEEIAALMGRLPADLSDPPGGVKAEDQGPFWLGYYHYAAGLVRAQDLGPEDLEKVGQALYGQRWQTDIARDLELTDARRVRQWMAGERPIPAGVWTDLAALAMRRRMLLDEILHDLSTGS